MMKSLRLRLGVTCALAALSFAPISKADTRDKKTKISLDTPIEVPGAVLAPGTYVFKLLDSSSNRHIVQITNENQNQTYALTFTTPALRLEPTDKTVLTFYEGKGDRPRAIRTWFYPGDVDGQEFVYRGEQARFLAVSKTSQVADTSSASKSESVSLEPAKPAESAVLAPIPTPPAQAAEIQTQSAPEEPVLLAQAQPQDQAPPPAAQPQTEQAPAVSTSTDELPKTASNLPLILLGGLSALGLALGVRRWDHLASRKS
jgi:hypothetical protein